MHRVNELIDTKKIDAREQNPFLASMSIKKCLSENLPHLDFILPGLLRGTVGIIAASGGTGKTTFLTQLSVALSADSEICGGLFSNRQRGKPMKILLVVAEENESIMTHRLSAAIECQIAMLAPAQSEDELRLLASNINENLKIVCLNPMQSRALVDAQGHKTKLHQQLMESGHGHDLIIIDPLRAVHEGDENDSAHANALVSSFTELAKHTNAAVILSHHMNKWAGSNNMAGYAGALRGSSALTDASRWQVNLSTPTEETLTSYKISKNAWSEYVKMDVAKSNYAPIPPGVLLKRTARGPLTLQKKLVAKTTKNDVS